MKGMDIMYYFLVSNLGLINCIIMSNLSVPIIKCLECVCYSSMTQCVRPDLKPYWITGPNWSLIYSQPLGGSVSTVVHLQPYTDGGFGMGQATALARAKLPLQQGLDLRWPLNPQAILANEPYA